MTSNINTTTNKETFAIFLDMDGVLNDLSIHEGRDNWFRRINARKNELFPEDFSETCFLRAAITFLDLRAVENLQTIIDYAEHFFKVEIILSSNWRGNHHKEDLKKCFSSSGFDFANYLTDRTVRDLPISEGEGLCEDTNHKDKLCRAAEINEYLINHPEITEFMVLDDIDNHLSKNFNFRFIQTDKNKLLNKQVTEYAIKLIDLLRSKNYF